MKKELFEQIATLPTFEERLLQLVQSEMGRYISAYVIEEITHFQRITDRGTDTTIDIKDAKNTKFQIIVSVNNFSTDINSFMKDEDLIEDDIDFLLHILGRLEKAKKIDIEIRLARLTINIKLENPKLNISKFERIVKGE